MVDKNEIQKYIRVDVGESVQYKEDNWYCTTTLNDAGLTFVFNGLGMYQGAAPRRVYVPFCDILAIYDEDGIIVAETVVGKFELR